MLRLVRLQRLIVPHILLVLLCIPTARPQSNATVAQADLNYLVESAKTILRGNVVSVVLEPHPQFPNLQTVVVTIAVAKTFKGSEASTLTFRQYVGNPGGTSEARAYHKSQELLLFLNPTSSYGLTSPVGMEQGQFRVLRDKLGNGYAINGRGNVGLFTDVMKKSAARGAKFSLQAKTMLTKSGGQVSLGALEETIAQLVAVGR